MTSKDVRKKYINFFIDRGHKEIVPASLIPENDPTTLFTSSGMQPLVPYLLGQTHPLGKRLVDSQPSFRAEDIEEVGDNRHTTFFEMLGNWSLGDYWKEDQLSFLFEFLTDTSVGLGFNPKRLYVSVFEGGEGVPKDTESAQIWQKVFKAAKIDPDDRIVYYGVSENWWSRAGAPEKMPSGEPGGPDSEVFFDFYPEQGSIGHDLKKYSRSGRLLEIGNSVFMQFQKQKNGTFKELPKKNVDFGGGLERLLAAANNENDIFKGDLHLPIIEKISGHLGIKYDQDEKTAINLRIIADHIKGGIFLIKNGVVPANKLHGYILRRLLRRSAVKLHQIKPNSLEFLPELINPVFDIYQGTDYFQAGDLGRIKAVITDEIKRFQQTLQKGIKEIEKIDKIDGKIAFDLYQTFGFPYEVTEELFKQKGQEIDKGQFKEEFEKHRQLSRTSSSGMFKGGLADHSETVIKYHTATHLLHQALRDVLGPQVFQKGSNITKDRLRFDFSYEGKMNKDEIKQTEEIINKRIEQDLKVDQMIVDLGSAKTMNAIGLFDGKYADKVSIYGVGSHFKLDPQAKDKRARGGYYSLEFCGGPHVEHTGVIGKIQITKEEAASSGIRRIRAEIVLN